MKSVVGFNRNDLNLGILFFQITASAHDRATGPDPRHEVRHSALRLLPNLRPRGL